MWVKSSVWPSTHHATKASLSFCLDVKACLYGAEMESTLGKSSTNWAPMLVCLSFLNQSFCSPGCSGTPDYPMLLTPTLEWQACVSYNFLSNQLTPLRYRQGLVLSYYHENMATREVNDTNHLECHAKAYSQSHTVIRHPEQDWYAQHHFWL